MDGVVTPNLVVKSLDQKSKIGFCQFVVDVFPNAYFCYSPRLEIPWVNFVRRDHESGKALDWCFRSLGALQIGRASGNERQITASREMYGRGLHYLVQVIKNPTVASMDVTLAAAVILGIYELVNSPDEESWLIHSRGIAHLFRIRGPQAHACGFGRTLMITFRGLFVFDALARGEACFLGSEEWRSMLPITTEDEERRGKSSPMTRLIDSAFNEIAQCPGFVVMTRTLVASSATDSERDDLIGVLTTSRDNLMDVETEMLVGIQADQEGGDMDAQGFFGTIPTSHKDTVANYSIEGIRTAIALLQQLLTVLASDESRRQQPTPWAVPDPSKTGWEMIKNPDVLRKMTHKKTRLHLTAGPLLPGTAKIWPDRILLTMGMPGRD